MKMKKLMIAAAIVCAAALTQAATIDWSIQNVIGPNGSNLSGGSVYTFSTKEGTIKTVDALTQALTEAGSDLVAFQAVLDKSYSALNVGTFENGGFKTAPMTTVAAGLSEGKSATRLFAVILDTDTLTADSKWYVVETSNSAKTPAAAAYGDIHYETDVAGASAGNWKNIPEPTSGLLMLLGVAGLALRRRRA